MIGAKLMDMTTNEKILNGEGLDPLYSNVPQCYYCVFEYHCKRGRDFSKPCSDFKGDTTVGGFDGQEAFIKHKRIL